MSKDFVNKDNKQIVPVRIREARISRGLSLSNLADEVGVTKQAISKYELGTMNVSSSVLLKIAEVLDFPINFFFKIKESEDENYHKSAVFFRGVKIPKKTKDALEQKIEFVHEIMSFLKKYIDFPELNLFNADEGIPKGYLDDQEIEDVAIKLREYWEVGVNPIKNLSNLLLKKGIIISRVELDTIKVDAYSKWIKGTPYIILGSDKGCAVRSRFDLAHELGHLIFHSHLEEEDIKKNHNQIEHEAHRFASAFLLPAEGFVQDLYNVSIDNFIYLKKKWKVSIQVMIRRCYDLDLITEKQYGNMNKYMSIKRWRSKEPLDDTIEFEKPNMIEEAFELLIENNIVDAVEMLEAIALNKSEIEKLCFLSQNYFDNYISKLTKPQIRLVK